MCRIYFASIDVSSPPINDDVLIYILFRSISPHLYDAQNCRLGPDRCTHKGCPETKRLLLHIKTCPLASSSPGGGGNVYGCKEKGCDSARKLLNHYKRCRDVRAQQAAQSKTAKPHVCLVCSLMARHAKTFVDSTCKKVSADVSKTERWRARIQQQQGQAKTVSFSFDSSSTPMRQSQSFDEMKTFDQSVDINVPSTIVPKPSAGILRSPSSQMMPPPPPRPPRAGIRAHQVPSEISKQLSSSAPATPSRFLASSPLFETPPSQHVLMQQRIEDVAASVAAPPFSSVEASALGKSYDSSRNHFPTSMVTRHEQQEQSQAASPRHRSDSLHFGELSLGEDIGTTAATSCSNLGTEPSSETTTQAQQQSEVSFGKRRSVSCDALTRLYEIREEEVLGDSGSEDGVFEMAEDDDA